MEVIIFLLVIMEPMAIITTTITIIITINQIPVPVMLELEENCL